MSSLRMDRVEGKEGGEGAEGGGGPGPGADSYKEIYLTLTFLSL